MQLAKMFDRHLLMGSHVRPLAARVAFEACHAGNMQVPIRKRNPLRKLPILLILQSIKAPFKILSSSIVRLLRIFHSVLRRQKELM